MTPDPRAPLFTEDATLHVVPVRALGQAAEAVVDRILDEARPFTHLEICEVEPDGAALVRSLVERARGRRAEAGERLSIAVRATPDVVTPDLAAALAKGRVVLKCLFEGPLSTGDAERLREIHRLYSSFGVPPQLAFVNVGVPLDRASFEAGPRAIVDGLAAAGAIYVELLRTRERRLSDEEHADLHRACVSRILEVNRGGRVLVEMGLALRLEAMSRGGRGPEPTVSIWASPERASREDAGLFGEGCAGCPHEARCGLGVLRDPTVSLSERRAGTPFCAASKPLFDVATTLIAAQDRARLRTIFHVWHEAHLRVARHLGVSD